MNYTNHGAKRCQQRAIPDFIVKLILDIGDQFNGGRGLRIVMARSRTTKREMKNELKSSGLSLQKGWERTYIVVDENDKIVTAGYRTKRIKNDI